MSKQVNSDNAVDVVVYRSVKSKETYVYLLADAEFSELPEAFLTQFGEGESFLDFRLHPEKDLAQADAKLVLAALAKQGFYLQLPPQSDIVFDQ